MPTYDFQCIRCGHEFEAMFCPVGTERIRCFACQPEFFLVNGKKIADTRTFAHRVYNPGNWTTGALDFKPRYYPAFGRVIETRKQLKREMRRTGVVEKGETPRRTRKSVPTPQEIEKAISRLKPEQVTEIRRRRERRDWEERNKTPA